MRYSFPQLLTSPMVSTRVYRNQIEDLLSLFVQFYGTEGRLNLETFAPLARALLLVVYQNTYLGDVRQVNSYISLLAHKPTKKLVVETTILFA